MELVSISKNPVPAGATVGTLRADDGVTLRFARWDATRGPRRGTMCLLPGRGEFIEKYFEVVADLRRRGYAVAMLDWRGQGGSERLLANPRKGHVRSFADYERDLIRFMKDVVLPDCPPPYLAMGHSMGGNVLLRSATLAGSWFDRMILTGPMIGIAQEKLGMPQPVARALAEVATMAGLGKAYVPGGSDRSEEARPFAETVLTSDAERYNRTKAIIETAPHLALGSPTIGWLRAGLRSCATLTRPDFPRQIRVPLLLVSAGADRIVSLPDIATLAKGLKIGAHVTIAASCHEVLMERDEIRARFWAAFDAYLGSAAEAA